MIFWAIFSINKTFSSQREIDYYTTLLPTNNEKNFIEISVGDEIIKKIFLDFKIFFEYTLMYENYYRRKIF